MFKIRLSDKSAYKLWKAYNDHKRLGHTFRAKCYKFILANTYSKNYK